MQKLVLLVFALAITANGLQYMEEALIWSDQLKLAYRAEYDAGITTAWGGSNMKLPG